MLLKTSRNLIRFSQPSWQGCLSTSSRAPTAHARSWGRHSCTRTSWKGTTSLSLSPSACSWTTPCQPLMTWKKPRPMWQCSGPLKQTPFLPLFGPCSIFLSKSQWLLFPNKQNIYLSDTKSLVQVNSTLWYLISDKKLTVCNRSTMLFRAFTEKPFTHLRTSSGSTEQFYRSFFFSVKKQHSGAVLYFVKKALE